MPYLRYFLAYVYQFQFHRALCNIAGQPNLANWFALPARAAQHSAARPSPIVIVRALARSSIYRSTEAGGRFRVHVCACTLCAVRVTASDGRQCCSAA